MGETKRVERPKKGERWIHEQLRGVWTVQSAGPRRIAVRSEIPGLGTHHWHTFIFMEGIKAGVWKPVEGSEGEQG